MEDVAAMTPVDHRFAPFRFMATVCEGKRDAPKHFGDHVKPIKPITPVAGFACSGVLNVRERKPMSMAPMTTRHQREMMEHAIGHPMPRGSKPGWRNYYCTDPDDADWMALVAAGLAIRGRTINGGDSGYFHVSEAGYKELGLKPPKESRL
jgi:hypothetical protein